MSSGGYDFISPPSRRHLYGKHVLGVWLGMDNVCNIIGERTFGLGIVCEARFQKFLAYGFPIHIQLVNSQSSGHPLGCATVVMSFHYRGVYCGNPLRVVPGWCFQCVSTFSDFGCVYQSAIQKKRENHYLDKIRKTMEIHFHTYMYFLVLKD